ncbi:Uncharacterized MFS-type transporter [hydrothermal vent metagenome]|uniref:Uncharacterized MFS-type transporter n=1 Tax=hydrothermal vent metagenome TaxID=652676 RepID=A0A3B0RV41_9ZZZZ
MTGRHGGARVTIATDTNKAGVFSADNLCGSMDYIRFLKNNLRWLMAGALLTLASTFGQTYFIALFGSQIREAFSLTHGGFGFVYMIATLASAVTLVWLGQLADVMRLKTLGLATIAGLTVAAFSMGFATSWIWLAISLYLLRLFGQGMMSHVAMTAMARWFNSHRGRALSVASLGHAVGEAILPGLAVVALLYVGWRETWLLAAGILALVIAPVFFFLTRKERAIGKVAGDAENSDDGAHWQRRQVLRDWLFYAMLPGTLASSFIVTVVFFHQAYLVETKGWSMAVWGGFYPFFAVAATVVALAVGWAVDRWSARQLLSVYLLPLALAVVIFAYGQNQAAGLAGMIAIGGSVGAAQTLSSAVWAELYGTAHLGSIKALTAAGGVLASAIGPGLTGYLLDIGVSLESIFVAMAVYCVVMSALFLLLQPILMSERKPGSN